MQEIIKNKIFLGSKKDYLENEFNESEWAFVHIGKELFNKFKESDHKGVLYTNKNHLYLSWLDVPEKSEFDKASLEAVFNFIDSHKNLKVLVHCDYGQSRSPAILMAYLSKRTEFLPKTFYKAVTKFKEIYPDYFFTGGITLFIKSFWNDIA